MKKRKRKRKPLAVLLAKAGAAASLVPFKGKARTFTDRKKEASRRACRGNQ
jgi:hypothetical protein